MKWFRFYSEALDDPKVQKLSAGLFKVWVNLLCVANDYGGALPPLEEIAYRVRLRSDRCQEYVSKLTDGGLIDVSADGLAIHNWTRRQYKSDDSGPRVSKLRAVTVTPPDTDNRSRSRTEQSRTEQSRGAASERIESQPRQSKQEIPGKRIESLLRDTVFVEELRARFSSLDWDYEVTKWRDHVTTKPPKANFKNSLRNWLENALKYQEERRNGRPAQGKPRTAQTGEGVAAGPDMEAWDRYKRGDR